MCHSLRSHSAEGVHVSGTTAQAEAATEVNLPERGAILCPMPITRRSFLRSSLAVPASAALARTLPVQKYHTRNRIALDPNRPQYHLLPARNWMNDPNGPIYWNGNYHLFYQYNPNAAIWGDMHWAHAMSPDLIHWQHLPIALSPTPGGPDSEGCFSGSAVNFNGTPTLIYTGVKAVPPAEATLRDGTHNFRESQCLATSSDPQLKTWTKLPQPVVPTPPPNLDVTGFRDPCLWQEGSWWYMGIGSGSQDVGGCVLLYRSLDLRSWTYMHRLANGSDEGRQTSDPVASGDMWECPDFFELNGQHVLLYSTERKVYWSTGKYDAKKQRFRIRQQGMLDHGAYYAPKSMLDADGNRVLWGWIQETRPEQEYARAGWAGLMSLPRVLTVGSDGLLHIQPSTRLETLREGQLPLHFAEGNATLTLRELRAELELTLNAGGGIVDLSLGNPTGHPTVWSFDPDAGSVRIDGARLPQALDDSQPMKVRFFLDASVVELFVNGALACTTRIYGLTPGVARLTLHDPHHSLTESAFWHIKPISPDRLTT